MKKKKIFLIITVILVLSFALAGCTMFSINKERDYKQTVASLTVDGVDVNITKGQLNESFMQNYQTYAQYGLTAEEILNLSLVNLAKREVLLVMAKDARGDKNSDAYSLLSDNEKAWVMKTTNKMFSDNWDELVKKKSKDEYNKNKDKDKEDDDTEILFPARKEYNEPEEDKEFKAYEKYTLEDDFFTQKGSATGIEKEAIDEIKKDIEDQYKDFSYFRDRNAEGRLLEEYQKTHKGVDIDITEDALMEEYNFTVNANKDKYLKGSNYATDIESDNGTILYHKGQYFKVKSNLLSFGKQQESIYKQWAAQYPGESSAAYIQKYRKALVTGGEENSAEKVLLDEMTDKLSYKKGSFDRGLLVNISNLNYKTGVYCVNKDCDCHNSNDKHKQLREDIENNKTIWGGETGDLETPLCQCPQCEFNAYVAYNVPYTSVLNMMANDIAQAEVDATAEYNEKYNKATFNAEASVTAGRKMFVADKKIETFDKWIFRVNDDPGMMDGKEYLVTPAGQESTYVAEFTALARAIISDETATRGVSSTTLSSYNIGDKTVELMTQKDAETNNSISYVINDFGVHIIMISTLPLDFNVNNGLIISEGLDENPDFDIDDYNLTDDNKKNELIKVNKIYQLSKDAFVSFDEETGKALTYNEVKKKSYVENAKGEKYSKFEINLFKPLGEIEDFFSKANKKGIDLKIGDKTYNVKLSKDNGVYGQLLKEVRKIDKANEKQAGKQQ